MKRFLLLLLVPLLFMSGCGGSSSKPIIENPYAIRMKELSQRGVMAMQKERWQAAEALFARAMSAARLSGRQGLVSQAIYNLAASQMAAGHVEGAEKSYRECIRFSEEHGEAITKLRGKVALALLRQQQGKKAWVPETMSGKLPVDLHLSLARLAQLQGRNDDARSEYRATIRTEQPDRTQLLYNAKAHLGLATLAAGQKDADTVLKQAEEVLKLGSNIGAPRLVAHAMVLKAKYVSDADVSQVLLRDAQAIYGLLKDGDGVSSAAALLDKMEALQRRKEKIDRLNDRVEELEKQ